MINWDVSKNFMDFSDYLLRLNQPQKEAVLALKGPVLIIAGAGSGKTRVLTYRLSHLLSQGITPSSVLALTFTNKAATEMSSRVKSLLEQKNSNKSQNKPNFLHNFNFSASNMPFMGTFHGFCLKVLKQEKTPWPNFVIYDEDDQKKIFKDLVEQNYQHALKPSVLANHISKAKNELITFNQYQEWAQSDFEKEIIAPLYEQYQKKLRLANALDFDDLLLETFLMLKNKPEILEKYQNKFQYLMVDEYQDINTAQYQLLKLLAAKNKNICVVGDVDQAIYGWRGADFRNILNFENDYPEAKIIKLEENYRSSKTILVAAQKVIEKNKMRREKTLWTKNPEGAKITIAALADQDHEAEYAVHKIKELIEQGEQLNEIAVLYRTNAQSRSLEEACLKNGLPYHMIGAYRFYERKEIKDILAYLRLIENKNDLLSWKRIINVPPRGLNLNKETWEQAEGTGLEKTIEILAPKKMPIFSRFLNQFEVWKKSRANSSLSKLIQTVIKDSGYFNYLNDGTNEGQERIENLNELVGVAKDFDNSSENSLSSFLESVALFQQTDHLDQGKKVLNLMTLHTVKGLEFDNVFITGLEEGIFPHTKANNQDELEEERRLCYVGITRARKNLFLTFAKQRLMWGARLANIPSRFLMDIPEELIEFENLSDEREWGQDNIYIE